MQENQVVKDQVAAAAAADSRQATNNNNVVPILAYSEDVRSFSEIPNSDKPVD